MSRANFPYWLVASAAFGVFLACFVIHVDDKMRELQTALDSGADGALASAKRSE